MGWVTIDRKLPRSKQCPARNLRPKGLPPTPQPSPTPSLALSSLHLRLQALEQEHQRLLKQIQRKRTELKNFVEQMRSLATQIFHRGEPLYRQLNDLDREIHELFEEVLKERKFGKQTRKNIQGIYEMLQLMGIISPQLEEEEAQELDDLFGAKEEEDFFASSRQESRRSREEAMPEAEGQRRTTESRQIRRTFLRLAEIFHPDRVADSQTQMRHTEIMKEINRAYQEGDLARLLEIERQHQNGETTAADSSSESDLTRQCERLATDNQLLKKQYENLKEELRLIRNTSEGEMVKDCRRAVREGIDPIEEMLTAAENQIQEVEKIRNFVQDFRNKKITIKEFVKGPPGFGRGSSEEIEDILDQFLAELHSVMKF